jgi:hypothetical protein
MSPESPSFLSAQSSVSFGYDFRARLLESSVFQSIDKSLPMVDYFNC